MPSKPDVVILCGGSGTRLRSAVPDVPKSMAPIAGRPFLELLLRQLGRHGFNRVILAVGYGEAVIRKQFGASAFGLELIYSSETAPLGTAGALRNCLDAVHTDFFIVMNGDSYTDADLSSFVNQSCSADAQVSIMVLPLDGRTDCGFLVTDHAGRVASFLEKQDSQGSRVFNAGIYSISKPLLSDIPSGVNLSLEKNVFPEWLAQGKRIQTFLHSGTCIDIGTPERYERAQQALAFSEAHGAV